MTQPLHPCSWDKVELQKLTFSSYSISIFTSFKRSSFLSDGNSICTFTTQPNYCRYFDQHGRKHHKTTWVYHPRKLTIAFQVFYSYTYGTAGWLALQAAPLIVSPTIMITLLSPDVREPTRRCRMQGSEGPD